MYIDFQSTTKSAINSTIFEKWDTMQGGVEILFGFTKTKKRFVLKLIVLNEDITKNDLGTVHCPIKGTWHLAFSPYQLLTISGFL